MANENLIPGLGYVSETESKQNLVPGAGFVNETVSAGAGTQALTAGLFTNTNAFYAPTVGRGAVALTAGLFTNTSAFYSPTVALASGTQALTAALFSNTNTFYSHTLSGGSVALTASLVTNTSTFYAPTVRSTYALTAPLVSNSNAFYAPIVTQDATQNLAAGLFSNEQAFYAHVLSGGAGAPEVVGGGGWVARDRPRYLRTQTKEKLAELVRKQREALGILPKQARKAIESAVRKEAKRKAPSIEALAPTVVDVAQQFKAPAHDVEAAIRSAFEYRSALRDAQESIDAATQRELREAEEQARVAFEARVAHQQAEEAQRAHWAQLMAEDEMLVEQIMDMQRQAVGVLLTLRDRLVELVM